jgi:ABC-2 type transport system ATP-binding protein
VNSEVVSFQAVSKKFGTKTALKQVSLSVSAGEVFGYIGPNGAGKTTTVRLLVGLLKPTEGKIGVFGLDPYIDDAVRTKVGVVLDVPGLWENLTVKQNMKYFCDFFSKELEKEIHNCLKTVGLLENQNQRVYTLSKGMKQRLSIARALIHNPDLLILDEPTANLDIEAQHQIRRLILSLAKEGKTIFLNSHNLPEVEQLCTRVGILSRGCLLKQVDSDNWKNHSLEQTYFETIGESDE